MEVQELINTFSHDPLIQRMPLPASVRKALNLPEEPEPTPVSITASTQAVLSNDYDTFEEKKFPEDIPFPDMNLMAKGYYEKYGISDVKEHIATIKEVVEPPNEEESAHQRLPTQREAQTTRADN